MAPGNNARFLTELAFKPAPGVDCYFDLTAPLVYDSIKAGRRIEADVGFRTNFVTGRKLLLVRRIVQDKMNRAAVIHDLLYETGEVSRSVADDVFLEAMLACEVAAWRAYAAWAAVRAVGWRFYSRPAQGQVA